MSAGLVLAVIVTLAIWAGSLYVQPFGRCPKCKGTGHIKRGPRRRPVCPRCKGRKRIQRRGSRTLHRLIFKIRDGRNAAAATSRRETDMPVYIRPARVEITEGGAGAWSSSPPVPSLVWPRW